MILVEQSSCIRGYECASANFVGIRVAFHQQSQAEQREGLLVPLQQRIRDVVQGPDGYIYIATEKTFRGNTVDGAVLRIEPAGE